MKTEEDEAFDELATRQGSWGGGFQAKRKMAADKLQEPVPLYVSKPALESWRGFASDYERGFIDGMKKQAQSSVDKAVNQMAQPAQEQCQKHGECFGGECIYPPAQEPVREALKLALEALKKAKRQCQHHKIAPHLIYDEAITTIKEALAQPVQEPEREALMRIADGLRRAGANLPAPEITGTIEGSVVTGLCIALALVETEIEALAQPR